MSGVDVYTLKSKPGVKRDGTDLDNEYYQDAQWCRFQRGKPKKMGGYRAMSQLVTGPIRNLYVDSRNPNNTAHAFSPWGVQQLSFDQTGSGAGVVDRTPAGLAFNALYNWQSDAMFNSGGGGNPVIVAAATPDLDTIASDATGGVYSGIITDTAALTAISDAGGPIVVSGGCCVLQPFLFLYGSNGLIRNSNANDFSVSTGWSGTNANTANVASTKIVKGLPVRGGASSPAGLFWALDALIRVTFVGSPVLWKYDTVSADTTVLSKAGIVEYDGLYFWIGVDRFYMYNGVVQELPNDMSMNYFFDNLNPLQVQKVFALKVPRFGEIWWFYPSGSNTECDRAIIFNVRQGLWYDAVLARTSGAPAQVFKYPVMTGGEPQSTTRLVYTAVTGTFSPGNTVTGGTSGAVAQIVRVLPGALNVTTASGTFVNGETVSSTGGVATGTVTAVPAAQELDTVWQHEYGYDKIVGASVTAIESHFETSNFQYATGGPVQETEAGPNNSSLIDRLEPDFISSGTLTVTVRGRKYANSPLKDGPTKSFTATTEVVDLRDQRRQMSIKIQSNEVGGFYEMGKPLIHINVGDERAA